MPKPRLCIWAGEKHKGNNVRPQRGDVVDVISTLEHPGLEVLGHPDWRIIDVDIQVDNPIAYMSWMIEPDDAPEGFLRWFRKHSVDLDSIEAAAAKAFGRSLASDDIIIVSIETIKQITKAKLSLPDPRIIR